MGADAGAFLGAAAFGAGGFEDPLDDPLDDPLEPITPTPAKAKSPRPTSIGLNEAPDAAAADADAALRAVGLTAGFGEAAFEAAAFGVALADGLADGLRPSTSAFFATFLLGALLPPLDDFDAFLPSAPREEYLLMRSPELIPALALSSA